MADTKISALTALTGANSATGDLFVIVDSDGSETKSITRAQLKIALGLEAYTKTDFTPTFAAGTATFSGETGWYYRDGNFMVGQAYAAVTAAGSTALTMTIPGGLTIDTSWILSTASDSQADPLGPGGKWFDSGSAYRHMVPQYGSTTTLKFYYDGGAALVGAALANNDYLSFGFRIPISEWA